MSSQEANDCYKFDLGSSTWSTVPSDSLRPRSVFGICTLGNKVVIFGGEVDPSAAGHSGAGDFENDVVCLESETGEWSTLAASGAPLARGWTRIAANGDNSFLLFGGLAGNDENPTRLDDMWQFSL